jgi:hypothetical protein
MAAISVPKPLKQEYNANLHMPILNKKQANRKKTNYGVTHLNFAG